MFDKENLVISNKKIKLKNPDAPETFKPLLSELLLGIASIFFAFISIYVATFLGVTNRSLFNASMLLLLTILLTLLLFIRATYYYFNRRGDLFIAGMIFLFINIIIVIWKIVEFISIPSP
ncbi:MAG: hypothetical protein WC915_05740 [archaeon]|jgi:hypothetical protein